MGPPLHFDHTALPAAAAGRVGRMWMSHRPVVQSHVAEALPIVANDARFTTDARVMTGSDGDGDDALVLFPDARFLAEGRRAGSRYRIPGGGHRFSWTPGGVECESLVPGGALFTTINLRRGLLAGLLPDPDLLDRVIVFRRDVRVTELLRLLVAEMRRGGAPALMLDGLLRAVAAAIVASPAAAEPERIRLTGARLRRVTDLVEARLAEDLAVADLAAAAGLSPFHFTRVFRAATGETPWAFVQRRRLERARALLLETQLPIADIARSCGFASPARFSTSFAAFAGLPPTRFRAAT